MKKISVLVLAIVAAIIMTGCGTKSAFIQPPGAPPINSSDGFKVGNVEDLSGFQFKPDDNDAFSLKEAMSAALDSALAKQGLTGAGPYSVNVNILFYAPGNAFVRWLLPGAGSTLLSVEAFIVDEQSVQVAKIPVERHISAGGGFTIGAYKYIFKDVAEEISSVIKKSTKAKAE